MLFKCRGAIKKGWRGVPGGPVVKNIAADARSRVWSLVWEDPTCCKATKPERHNYWSHVPGARALQQEKPLEGQARAPQLSSCEAPLAAARESPPTATKPSAAKNKYVNIFKGRNVAICSNIDASGEYQTKSDENKYDMKSLICRI